MKKIIVNESQLQIIGDAEISQLKYQLIFAIKGNEIFGVVVKTLNGFYLRFNSINLTDNKNTEFFPNITTLINYYQSYDFVIDVELKI